MKKIILLLLVLIIIILFKKYTNSSLNQIFDKSEILIKNTKIQVMIADSPYTRQIGLSNKKVLPKGIGMLFLFPSSGNYSFWMKDMLFGLDFIFINNGKIVDIITNVPFPKINESPKVVNSFLKYDRVLELNEGAVEEYHWQIGDAVIFK